MSGTRLLTKDCFVTSLITMWFVIVKQHLLYAWLVYCVQLSFVYAVSENTVLYCNYVSLFLFDFRPKFMGCFAREVPCPAISRTHWYRIGPVPWRRRGGSPPMWGGCYLVRNESLSSMGWEWVFLEGLSAQVRGGAYIRGCGLCFRHSSARYTRAGTKTL